MQIDKTICQSIGTTCFSVSYLRNTMAEPPKADLSFSNPGDYRIQVLGKVDEGIWECFEGETEEIGEDTGGRVTTTLSVHVRDQAELSGLINTLNDWRLVLLSIKVNDMTDHTER